MNELKIAPPWVTYWRKCKALFELDKLVTVEDIEENDIGYEFDILVSGTEKYNALCQIIPDRVTFGNVILTINVVKALGQEEDLEALFKAAFAGNPILKDVVTAKDFAGVKHTYVRFQPDVIQFPNDDISDYNGNWSGLAQTIAREVFEAYAEKGVHFCTADLKENG